MIFFIFDIWDTIRKLRLVLQIEGIRNYSILVYLIRWTQDRMIMDASDLQYRKRS